jgi:RNA-binding protein
MKLSSKQRAFLLKKAHKLEPIVRIGKDGIGDNIKSSILDAISSRELIKVKILQNCEEEKSSIYDKLSSWNEIDLVGMIGRTLIIFKENKDEPTISYELKAIK